MNETTPGAPLTATVGERVGEHGAAATMGEKLGEHRAAVAMGEKGSEHHAARTGATSNPAPRARRRPFPWGTLALAAVGWAFATGLGNVVRGRARRARRRAVRLGSGAVRGAVRLAGRVPLPAR